MRVRKDDAELANSDIRHRDFGGGARTGSER
jgi:hypothetical protein